MRLSILIFCCFQGTCWTSDYCVHQPKTLYVKEGESVTIPCSYTHPEDPREKTWLIVTWAEADGVNCYYIKKYITDISWNIAKEYKDRISTVHHPDNRTASITIRGLKAADGIMFCCGVTRYTTGSAPFTWYHLYGTSLVVPDGRSMTQVEELIAVPGEEMIIPCHYPPKTSWEALEVTWYTGDHEQCARNEKIIHTWTSADTYGRFSLVNFPDDVSLRIHSVQHKESPRYCCRVTISDTQITPSKFGTELTVAGPPSSSSTQFSVTQPYNIPGHTGESVILNCSYSGYKESDVLGVNIYWRLGNITGPYVYHPYKEMVHPSYRGRTEITEPADLNIRGLQTSDNATYYCFVMLRQCAERFRHEKLIQYGAGTRLIVTDPAQTESHLLPTIIFVSYIGSKFFISLVLFLLTSFY